jgi:hypothetical protein
VEQNGVEVLPKLLTAIKAQLPGSEVSEAIAEVSGKDLAGWDKAWRAHLAQLAPTLDADFTPGGGGPERALAARRRRLGELLLDRGHHHGAAHELASAYGLVARDASVRCLYSDALRGLGEVDRAAALVDDGADILLPSGRWWSLHEQLTLGTPLPHARMNAIALDPFSPPIPCHELPEGELPADPVHRAICEAAWRVPRE